jgi:hypothetical protein
MESTNPSSIVEKFTFASSDISAKVTKYAAISRSAGDVIGSGLTIEAENASQTFNSLETDRAQFFKTGTYDFGYSTESGTNDTIQLFGGELVGAKFKETKVKMSFEDRLSRLKNRKVGSRQSPVSFTNTSVNPADLGWWIVTSYGGLSTVKSTSNTDISYQHWQDWFDIFDDESIAVSANFEGDSVIEILENIQKLTDSTIYAEGDNKLYFNRWTGVASDTITITDSFISGPVEQTINGNDILNRVIVQINYTPSSDTWGGQITSQNTESVNSYGLFETVYDNETVWFVDSPSAINQAERVVFRRNQPNATYKFKTPLTFLDGQLGDEILLTTQVYSLSARPFTLQGYKITTGKKTEMTLELDEGFSRAGSRLNGFILDDAYWGLLDEPYNPLL